MTTESSNDSGFPILTKDQILGADDIGIREVHVKALGWMGTVCLRTMSAADRDAWEAENFANRRKGVDIREGLKDFRAKLLVRCMCDREGVLLFSLKDIPALSKKSAAALDQLFDAAQEMNGMKRESLDEAVENLLDGQSDA